MPNATNTNITTLSHLYQNAVPHRRDFVRENKEYVREKSKQQIIKAKPQIDGYMPFSSSADQISSRSTGYKSINFAEAMRQRTSKGATSTPGNIKPRSPKKKQSWKLVREVPDRNIPQKATKSEAALPPKRPFSSTKVKIVSMNKTKVNTNSVAVQTDEINDEIYLYNALKKCASPAFKSALKAKYLQKERDTINKPMPANNDSQEIELPLDDSQELWQPGENNSVNREQKRQKGGTAKIASPLKTKSAESARTALTHVSEPSSVDFETARDFYDCRPLRSELHSNLNVMTMSTDGVGHCSPSKCTNCPVGYHLLGEDERNKIKEKLLDHEALLIRQLNSFPLAIETLRVRQSKTRIEKELSILEQNLRKLTKRKVYAKIHE